MRPLHRVLLMLCVAVGAGCQHASVPPVAKVADVSPRLDPKTLTFRHPGTGHLFTLHLGKRLDPDAGGSTKAPTHIKGAVPEPTTSYYEPRDEESVRYARAESSYTRNQAGLVAQNTRIQYQPDSGRLLITEDTSDGRPEARYILYTPARGGYKVTYLMPGYTDLAVPVGAPVAAVPAAVRLLGGDRAEINGKTVQVSAIPQSPSPFSVSD